MKATRKRTPLADRLWSYLSPSGSRACRKCHNRTSIISQRRRREREHKE